MANQMLRIAEHIYFQEKQNCYFHFMGSLSNERILEMLCHQRKANRKSQEWCPFSKIVERTWRCTNTPKVNVLTIFFSGSSLWRKISPVGRLNQN